MKKVRKLCRSPNGDRWYLVLDPSSLAFAHDEASTAAGGTVAQVAIGAFLGRGRGPEQQASLRVIATLVRRSGASLSGTTVLPAGVHLRSAPPDPRPVHHAASPEIPKALPVAPQRKENTCPIRRRSS
jgi:hypothetical protein